MSFSTLVSNLYLTELSWKWIEVEIPETLWEQLRTTHEALKYDAQAGRTSEDAVGKSINQYLVPLFEKFNEWGVQHRQLLNTGACSWKLPKSYCLTTVLREMAYGVFIFPLLPR